MRQNASPNHARGLVWATAAPRYHWKLLPPTGRASMGPRPPAGPLSPPGAFWAAAGRERAGRRCLLGSEAHALASAGREVSGVRLPHSERACARPNSNEIFMSVRPYAKSNCVTGLATAGYSRQQSLALPPSTPNTHTRTYDILRSDLQRSARHFLHVVLGLGRGRQSRRCNLSGDVGGVWQTGWQSVRRHTCDAQ